VVDVNGKKQIITCGDPWVISYELTTGQELWRAKCLGGDVVPSAVYVNGLVYAVSPDGKLAAIRPGGRGEVTETHILWSVEGDLPSICSPVCNGPLIWLVDSGGLVTCHDATNGERIWQRDLGASFQASPTVVGDLLYVLSDDGTLFILKADRTYALVGRIELGEPCQASPAFQAGRMYIRTEHHLYCFGGSTR
jgi:outer membrane protein assembly factor BamB